MTEVNLIIEDQNPLAENRTCKLIRISGELDETNVDEQMQKIYEVIGEHPSNLDIIFDFQNLGYLNSKTIGYLTDIYGKLAENNGKVAIFGARPNVLDTLQVVGLTQLINMYDSLDQSRNGITAEITPPQIETPQALPNSTQNIAPVQAVNPEPQVIAPAQNTQIETPQAPPSIPAPQMPTQEVPEQTLAPQMPTNPITEETISPTNNSEILANPEANQATNVPAPITNEVLTQETPQVQTSETQLPQQAQSAQIPSQEIVQQAQSAQIPSQEIVQQAQNAQIPVQNAEVEQALPPNPQELNASQIQDIPLENTQSENSTYNFEA